MKGVLGSRRWKNRFFHIYFCFSIVLLASLTESQSKITFLAQPQDTAVVLGQAVTLKCVAQFGDRRIRYSWTLDGNKIRPTDRVIVNQDGSLSIIATQKEDAGEYICVAKARMNKRNYVESSRAAALEVQSICEAAKIASSPSQSLFPAGILIQLRCKCNGMPKVTVEWKKDGVTIIPNSEIVASGNRLNFENPKVADSGNYTCIAQNFLGVRESPAFKMSVIVASVPVFQVRPSDTIAVVGDTITLYCSATGTPKPDISWYLETSTDPLKNSSKISANADGSLKISNIEKSDFGTYKCVASNIMANYAVEAEVGEAFIGEMVLAPPTRYILEKQPFTFACDVKGLPKPTISWSLADGKSLPAKYDMKGTALRNNKTAMEDSGNFTCTASNTAGKKSQTVQIIISQPPVLTEEPKDMQAMEGLKVVLKCAAKGVPPPKLIWQRNQIDVVQDGNHEINSRGYLVIRKVAPRDGGLYECIARHLGGWEATKTANVSVMAAVKLADYHQVHHKFDLGSKGKIYCTFKGHPPVKIVWAKVGGAELSKKTEIDGDTLIIKDLQMSDAGMYSCTGMNGFSNYTAYVNVSVFVYPKFELKPKNTTAMAMDSIWLHCNASGYPKPKISWGKEQQGGDNLDKERFIQFENGSLLIKNIKLEDEGRYYCIAGNLADFKQITISLKVVRNSPAEALSSTASMGRAIGIAVGCAAAYIVLVVGLMIYCKGRRARQQKKDQLTTPVNGDVENDEEAQDDLALQPINTTRTGYNKMEFPRHDLEALRTLGNGSYGRAFLARASGIKDGERETMVVVKSLIAKDDIVREDFTRELESLVNMEHSNVVSLLGVCRDSEPFYMIFECFEKGDLKQFLLSCNDNGRSTLTSSHKLTMCSNIVSGMSYLAANKFVHKDLAARNCMVTKDLQVKIGFLNLSYDLYNAEYYRFNNILIPLRWMPSEAIFHDDFTEKSDVWSFGVLAWEIYSLGQIPYTDRSDEEVLKCVKDDLRLPKPDNCPDNMANVMKKCWEPNPNDRPNFDMIFAEMSEVAVDSHV